MEHHHRVDICPDCYAASPTPKAQCPSCGADRQRRETLDRALMLALVLIVFGVAWSTLAT